MTTTLPRSRSLDSQFLMQASFGPTQKSLAEIASEPDYFTWIKNQMQVPAESHREYYRSRLSPRARLVDGTETAGTPSAEVRDKCASGSMWTRFAFTKSDVGKTVDITGTVITVGGTVVSHIDPAFAENGLTAPDSCTDVDPASGSATCSSDKMDKRCKWQPVFLATKACQTTCWTAGAGYAGDDCSGGWPAAAPFNGYVCAVDETLGGPVQLATSAGCSGSFTTLPNPGVYFSDAALYSVTSAPFTVANFSSDVVVLDEAVSPCSLKSTVQTGGALYRNFPRLFLLGNTVEAPASETRSDGECVFAPKSFVNEASCKLLPSSCSSGVSTVNKFELNADALQRLYTASSKNVYYITGLVTTASPCNAVSRWVSCSNFGLMCSPNVMGMDATMISSAIDGLTGNIRSINVACGSVPAHAVVTDGSMGQWKHVHINEYTVYDFTTWVNKHPGGKQQIRQWAAAPFNLQFPHGDSDMTKWTSSVANVRNSITYLGVLGSSLGLTDLPAEFQTPEIATALFGSVTSIPYTWACGSPGEVASDPKLGHQFGLMAQQSPSKFRDETIDTAYHAWDVPARHSKATVWLAKAMNGQDQLRQRMAWALAQIYVIGVPGLGQDNYQEFFTNYYDIFIRNAFKTHRELLREVTYSPVMGRYLSFAKSWSFDFDSNYPDENYAREVMQLFTIGLWKLNPDGTPVTDGNGDGVPTYSNAEIMDFARVFTGFDYYAQRANVETSSSVNLVDFMFMTGSKHDIYPKMDLYGGYLGDGYPLCSDLPADAHLKQGAVWELASLGGIAELTVMNATDGGALFAALCGSASAPCTFANKVTLPSTIACTGDECSAMAGTLQAVKVDVGYYKYVAPACVNMFFWDSGKLSVKSDTTKENFNWDSKRTCQNPGIKVAAPACCKGCSNLDYGHQALSGATCDGFSNANQFANKCRSNSQWQNYKICEQRCWNAGEPYPTSDCNAGAYAEARPCAFPREIMSWEQAADKCTALGMRICDRATADACQHAETEVVDVWLNETCDVKLRVMADGHVASLQEGVSGRNPSNNPFRVAWTGGSFPTAAAAPPGCVVMSGSNTLDCSFTATMTPAFTALPTTAQIATLKIGAMPPAGACTDGCSGAVKAYAPNGLASVDAVFEHAGKFYKNAEATVTIGSFSFRNPPAFMELLNPTDSQAEAEVEAFLDHVANHVNTPPFISRILIQRLVTSSPSTAYINDVAEAFRTGTFQGEFSGKYGDLGAVVSAILLHPEARGLSGDAATNGKLREPLVKLVHVFRALEYMDKAGREVVLHGNGAPADTIGQFPYMAPHVFNFYTPDYKPVDLPAGTFAPEFGIFTPPWMIGWLNGALDLVDTGLSYCFDGLGAAVPGCNHHPDYNGGLTFDTGNAGGDVVSELDVLLTGGRLGPSAETVRIAYDAGATAADKVKAAEKAILMSPEFNTMGSLEPTGTLDARTSGSSTGSVGSVTDYKAMILLFLRGGADTFNLIIPLGSDCALSGEYTTVRTNVGLNTGNQIPVAVAGQACANFGIHSQLTKFKDLYDLGQIAFATNLGSMVEPMTITQYNDGSKKACSGMFSHSDQIQGVQTMMCQSKTADVGFGGLMGDALQAKGYTVQSFSVAGQQPWASGYATTPIVLSETDGAVFFTKYDQNKDMLVNISSQKLGNVYADTFNKKLITGIETMENLKSVFASVTTTETFNAEESISRQLEQVAKTIKTYNARGVQRDLFYVELGGFDHHADEQLALLDENFRMLNEGITKFVAEMTTAGLWDKVVIVSGSDFARTLTSNGEGSDHAWAGQNFILGGKVNGGRMHHEYPTSLLEGNEQDLGRGRMLPKYPLESLFAPVAEWMGLSSSELGTPFRNFGNFNNTGAILSLSAVFNP